MTSLLAQNLENALKFIRSEIILELTAQGHRASGKTFENLEIKITLTSDGAIGQIIAPDYIAILDKGIKPDRVPYTPGSGAKSSKYIQALIRWIGIVKPGLADFERKSFAFAIAMKAKKEGHPTRGSYAFSHNGRRTGWASAIDKTTDFEHVLSVLDLGSYLIAVIDNFVSQYQRIAMM